MLHLTPQTTTARRLKVHRLEAPDLAPSPALQQLLLTFLSFTVSQSSFKLTSTESVMLSNHLILRHLLLLLPSVFPSIRVFSRESALHIRWPKDWSFNFSISPSNEYSGLISFRIDWFDPAVQGTLKSLLHLKKQKTYI